MVSTIEQETKFLIRRKFWHLFGGAFFVYNQAGDIVLFADQKAFRLREDIRLYSDREKKNEVLWIHARQIIDFSASYQVHDSRNNELIGVLQRKGWKSILKDEWIVFDEHEKEIAILKEDSRMMAALRRTVTNLIPQRYDLLHDGKRVVNYDQNFNPFIYKLRVDFSEDTKKLVDKRLGLALGILLAAVEGKQG